MFNRSMHVVVALMLTIASTAPAEAAKHHKHRYHNAGLSRIVQDTRTPPCITCSACHTAGGKTVCENAKSDKYRTIRGYASWYGGRFHGRRTASGERFNQHALTAAHKTLPLGTRVHVKNLDNGQSVVVTINDRGPYARGRIIDLSRGAAQAIHMAGTERVELTVLGRG